jgi:YD repeat-containing protein
MKYTFNKTGFYYGLLGVLLLAALIDSCRPKNGSDVEPDVDSTSISTCIPLSERVNGALLRSFEYDSTRRLVRMVEYTGTEQLNKVTKRYTFEYNRNAQLTRIRETNVGVRDRNFIYELDYDGNNVSTIRPYRVFNSGPRPEDTLKVVYDNNNRVTELQSLRGNRTKWEYDSAGNVKKWLVRTAAGSDSLIAEYTAYDDKVNIYTFSKGIQFVNLLSGRAASKRNPTRFTYLGVASEVSYLYNEKRVPTEAIVKFRTPSDTTLRETVYRYEQSCQ